VLSPCVLAQVTAPPVFLNSCNMEKSVFDYLVSVRRKIHQNPELGYCETETAALICAELDKAGIAYKAGYARTGVVAEISRGSGPLVVLRADMDALPIREKSGLNFSSTKVMKSSDGREIPLMHACGHDLHTTMLLGAALELNAKNFNGSVRFVFQPSEEDVYDDPDKKSGGQRMVEEGVLDGAKAAVGLHVHPLLPVGRLAYKLGQALACANFFRIRIKGRMAHAAVAPHLGIDAILVASTLINNVSAIASKYIAPHQPTVISFTKINGGIAPNVIADDVLIEGTVRALDLDTFNTVIERMEKIVRGVADSFDAEISITYNLNYPSLLNDEKIHEIVVPGLKDVFGADKIQAIDAILGSEDFAFYSRKVPSMFYFLGAQDTAEQTYFLHDSRVVFNEACIPYGTELLVRAAEDLLRN
jgi:amidohydrolase